MTRSRSHSNTGHRHCCLWAGRRKAEAAAGKQMFYFHLMNIPVRCSGYKINKTRPSPPGSQDRREEVMNSLRKQVRYYIRKDFQAHGYGPTNSISACNNPFLQSTELNDLLRSMTQYLLTAYYVPELTWFTSFNPHSNPRRTHFFKAVTRSRS